MKSPGSASPQIDGSEVKQKHERSDTDERLTHIPERVFFAFKYVLLSVV